MVKIKTTSEFLRPEDLNDGEIITIVGEGRYRSADETPFNREVFELPVKLANGQVKPWTVNKTTQRRFVSAWGDESKSWAGKKVKVELVKQNVRGELKTVIYGHPMAEELPGTVETKPKMTRAEALEKVKSWPEGDAKAYLKYLEDTGQIPKA